MALPSSDKLCTTHKRLAADPAIPLPGTGRIRSDQPAPFSEIGRIFERVNTETAAAARLAIDFLTTEIGTP
jgi:hypothetical protein